MSQRIPIYIPTFINSPEFAPARVLPRLYFYNGQVACETWYFANENNFAAEQYNFPYFDHYNVVTGSFPTADSLSLLFNNEAPVYGEVPTNSLYATYWSKYIAFLYNPYTRILDCEAIIPLADYVKMELNDIVNFRGNYYHLRAINDYSLKDGTCNLQLLGPIISDVFSTNAFQPTGSTTTSTTTTTTASPLECDFTGSAQAEPGTTTTSTSTTSTTTTSTTTTSTTTTTTAGPFCNGSGGDRGTGTGCLNWNIIAATGGCVVRLYDCSGTLRFLSLNTGETGTLCGCNFVTPTLVAGVMPTMNQVGECTTTTTSTTTSTTTNSPLLT